MIELHQKRAAVIGLGQSGLAMARWLARAGCSRVQVFDDRAQPPGLEQLRTLVPDATFESRPLDATLLGDMAGVSAPQASQTGSGPAQTGTTADSPRSAGAASADAASAGAGGSAVEQAASPVAPSQSASPAVPSQLAADRPVVHLPYGQVWPDDEDDDDTDGSASGTSAGDAASAAEAVLPDLSDQPFDLLAWSPGVSIETGGGQQLFQAARRRGIPVVGELDLFMDAVTTLQAQGADTQVVAITGTNGKTTVTRLCAFLANEAGVEAVACGNISPSLLDALMDRLGDTPIEAMPAGEAESVPASTALAARAEERLAPVMQPDAMHADASSRAATSAARNDPQENAPAGSTGSDAASVTEQHATAAHVATGAAARISSALAEAEQALTAADVPTTDEDAPAFLPPPVQPKREPSAAAKKMPRLWALELSSFQLAVAQPPSVQAATVLNVTPDHVDWHGSMQNYRAAKMRIYEAARRRVINLDDPLADPDVPTPWELAAAEAAAAAAAAQPVKGRGRKAKPKVVEPERAPRTDFSLHTPHTAPAFGLVREGGLAWLTEAIAEEMPTGGRRRKQAEPVEFILNRMMPADALRVQGAHNHANVLAALALLRACDVPMRAMLHALRAFVPDHHRCEPVTVIDGIEYIDDSKGTNIGATVAALQGLGRRAVLIAGGVGKDQDFSLLAPSVAAHARAVVLIGRDAPLLRDALADTGVPLHDATGMDAAVRLCATLAQPGDVVLLSPACASFDMFTGYAQRGDVFAQAVRSMAGEAGQPC